MKELYISFGSNVGDSISIFRDAVNVLSKVSGLYIQKNLLFMKRNLGER